MNWINAEKAEVDFLDDLLRAEDPVDCFKLRLCKRHAANRLHVIQDLLWLAGPDQGGGDKIFPRTVWPFSLRCALSPGVLRVSARVYYIISSIRLMI